MSGETNLNTILANMRPSLNEGDFVFVSVRDSFPIDIAQIKGSFREKEGITVILEREQADALNLNYDYEASCITLNVHSALESVGLTAAVSNALANKNISCNVVAAYYHDHIFVERKDAERAMEVLQALTNQNNSHNETLG